MTALRAITDQEVADYERDGFVKLPHIISAEWVARLKVTIHGLPGEMGDALAVHDMDMPGESERRPPTDREPARPSRFLFDPQAGEKLEPLRLLCVESPLAELASQLYRGGEIRPDECGANGLEQQCAAFWITTDGDDNADEPVMRLPDTPSPARRPVASLFVSRTRLPDKDPTCAPATESQANAFSVRYVEQIPGAIIVHHYRNLRAAGRTIAAGAAGRAVALHVT